MATIPPDTESVISRLEAADRLLIQQVFKPIANEYRISIPGPGSTEEGMLFWQAWVNHAGNSLFSTADAHGPIRRGLFLLSCNSVQLLDAVAQANPQLGTLVTLLNAPAQEDVCPASQQGPAAGGGTAPAGG